MSEVGRINQLSSCEIPLSEAVALIDGRKVSIDRLLEERLIRNARIVELETLGDNLADSSEKLVGKLRATIAKLEAVAAKWPKTKDGARVVPGMALCQVVDGELMVGQAQLVEGDEWLTDEELSAAFDDRYSTAEAAREAAAREAAGGGNDG